MIRNLLCHIYPRREGGHWRRTVEKLVSRWDLFTGSKFVGVAIDTTTEGPSIVRNAFGPIADEIEFLTVANSGAQEVETFRRLLPLALECDGVTTYIHSKGCTHADPQGASHLWREAMLEINLDYPELIECAMERYPIAGAFRSTQRIGNSPADWHYAGTVWTFDNAALRSRNWRHIEAPFWGVESYPGTQFSQSESCCLFWPSAQTAKLYGRDFWDRIITPALVAWRERMAACGIERLAENPHLQMGREHRQLVALNS